MMTGVIERSAALPAVVAFTLLCCVARAETQPADLVLRSGVVHTLDAKRPKAQAIAIAGRRIVAVGSDAEIARYVGSSTRVINLAGATAIPGFKESHGHLLSMGFARMSVDISGMATYPEVVKKLGEAARTRKPGEWIEGGRWHEEKWTDKGASVVRGFPTHHALSAATPNNPVVLERADGHAVLVNAKAMALMGITKDTPAPEGGEIVKEADGAPIGIFVDRAQSLIRVPPPTAEQTRKALELAMRECVEKGVTAFDDAGVDAGTIDLYKEYARAGKLEVRLYPMLDGYETLRKWRRPEPGLGDGMLTIRSVKLVADGAMGSRGALLLEPYDDDPGNSGLPVTPAETILEASRYGLAHGFQVNTHAIGDHANRLVLDAYEKAFAEHPEVKDPRFRIEHAQILDEHDIPRFGKLGVIASMQGIHCTSDRPWAPNRLGMPRVLEGLYVWQKLLQSGARIINGTDAPVEDVDPLKSFYASVTRQSEQGPPGGFEPDQRMSRAEALRSYTLEAAYGSFEEKELGSLEAGKLADLTVLSKDILDVADAEVLKAQVLYTIVDGRIRHERARALTR
jgi:predicted amidohydrolase YtcJ